MSNIKYSTYEIRVNAIKALLNSQHLTYIARAYNVDRTTLYRWKVKYSKNQNFSDLSRKIGSGKPPKLTQVKLKKLKEIVLKPASKFSYETDFWTCRRLMQVIKEKFNIDISQPTMWRMLRRLNLTFQMPERRYYQADAISRQEWLNNKLPEILETVKKHKAILYFEDESNISLTPVLGKTWAPKGETPIQVVTGSRGSISAMSAISKSGRLLFTLHDKTITSKEVVHFLDQMLDHHKRRHLVVIMDQAPPHIAKRVKTFVSKQKRLHLYYLPSYSPDFNPDEQVWNHLKNQELRGHQAKTKSEMKELVQKKLTDMSNNSKLLAGLFFKCNVANLMN